MRIKIVLDSKNNTKLDLNYNYYISSMIYNLLEKSSIEYSKKLHEDGYRLGGRKFKLFTFSKLIPKKFVREDGFLIINGKSTLYISSPMKEFILNLAYSLI